MATPNPYLDPATILYQLKAPIFQPSVCGFTELAGDVKSGWDEESKLETHVIEFRNPKSGQTIILRGERDNPQGKFSYKITPGKNPEAV